MSDNVCLAISIRKAMISSQCSSWIFNHNGPRQKCLQVPYTHTQTQKRTQRDTHSLSNLWMDSLQSWAASRLGLCVVSSFAHLFASMGPLFNFNYMNLNCALRLAPLATLCVRPSSNQAYDKLIANVYTGKGTHTHIRINSYMCMSGIYCSEIVFLK